jgi:hypothetical protein
MRSLFELPNMESMEAEWEWLRRDEGAKAREMFSESFWKMFPEGHNTSLRAFVQNRGTGRYSGLLFPERLMFRLLHEIHPDVFEFLFTYGRDYTPQVWGTPPKGDPMKGACFINARVLTKIDVAGVNGATDQNEPIVYVEGVAFGSVVRPMLHAWNTHGLQGAAAVDWTHYPVCEWSRYFGIPFTASEVEDICRMRQPGWVGPLFHRSSFTTRMRDRMTEILQEREWV